MPTKQDLKFALLMSAITTLFVTFILVSVNMGYTSNFVAIWMRSWLIAGVLVSLSILYLAPILRKFLNKS